MTEDLQPGWYVEPSGDRRYWDGQQWLRPVPAEAEFDDAPPPRLFDWFGAIVAILLIPPLALVAGILWLIEGGGKRTIGLVTTVFAGLWLLAWLSAIGSV